MKNLKTHNVKKRKQQQLLDMNILIVAITCVKMKFTVQLLFRNNVVMRITKEEV